MNLIVPRRIFYHFDDYQDNGFVSADPLCQHKKSIEILDRLMDMAHERNIFAPGVLPVRRAWLAVRERWAPRVP